MLMAFAPVIFLLDRLTIKDIQTSFAHENRYLSGSIL